MWNSPFMVRVRANQRWTLRFWLLSAALFMLIGLIYWPWLKIPPGNHLAALYLVLTQIGWFGLFAIASMLITLPLLVLPRLLFRLLCTVLGLAITVLLAVDTQVFEQFRFHLNGFVFTLFFSGGDTIEFSWLTWLIAITVAVLLAAALGIFGWLAARPQFSRRMTGGGYAIILLALIGSQSIHAWEDANYHRVIPNYSDTFPLYYPLTAKDTLIRWGLVDAAKVDAERRRASKLDHIPDGHFHYPLSAIAAAPPAKPMNILFVMIDAWRFDDAIGAATPHISDFARQSLRFMQHESGGNSTQAGIFSLFYSIPATYFTAAKSSGRRPAMMQLLADNRYQFAILGSAALDHPPFDRTVFSGIENLRVTTPGKDQATRDRRITDDFKQFLDSRDAGRPFFGFLFYDAVHGYDLHPDTMQTPFRPYWERVDHIMLDNAFDPTPYHNRYRNVLLYDDALIGEVLAKLKQQGLDDNTIVVVTTDHGEEFNDNHQNYWGHGSNFSQTQVHVPLFIRWPGMAARDIDYRTSHLDVIPTLMTRALGVTTPMRDYSVGRDLLTPDSQPRHLIVGSYYNYAIVSPNELDVVTPDGMQTNLTPTLQPLGRPANKEALRQAMEEMSRFYR
ncbi:DUF3413 domain-containing protein [Pluralibacter gergoviae]|nr:DUF3413 domain-containing protein [Pluralibacter gergoviae]EKV3543344.1 DUF3413 domain-containing protein [Pluralibacter gergoviae]EKV9898677.1 DUF3413 domain-containing protein [Pluralibacter gergoviae]EKV9929501.1 DUF3413 domain-containing protein [Pluralibacter gergoviae]EKW9975121.1 DUF3413 domain-containing protein [Pluralibacter gergoviae]